MPPDPFEEALDESLTTSDWWDSAEDYWITQPEFWLHLEKAAEQHGRAWVREHLETLDREWNNDELASEGKQGIPDWRTPKSCD